MINIALVFLAVSTLKQIKLCSTVFIVNFEQLLISMLLRPYYHFVVLISVDRWSYNETFYELIGSHN